MNAQPGPESPRRHSFPRSHRLTHAREFDAVFAARLRKSSGPIVLSALASDRSHPRLGLSIGRRVGGAVVRNRLKRLLREAFRLSQHDLPAHADGYYDWVIAAKPHVPLSLDQYLAMLLELARACHQEHQRRASRQGGSGPTRA